ncbi:MAG: hypothetical protein ABIJ12_10465 [bacterium]
MLGIRNLSIELLSGSPVLTFLAFLTLAALAVYLYYKTNPPLPNYIRIILGALRIIALIALFLALLQPILSFTKEYTRPKKVSLMLDRSLSMDRVESGLSRTARMDSLLSTNSIDYLKEVVDLSTYYIGDNITPNAAEIQPDKTSLGEAFYSLQRMQAVEPDDYWILCSDGNSNSGRDMSSVARNLQTPIITIDMSGGLNGFDVGIDNVDFNPIVFVGRQTEVKVKLAWHEARGKNIEVSLLDSNMTLDKESFPISQDEGFGEVTLKYIPTEPGQKLLNISIPELAGEETSGNNQKSFSTKVLKSKLLVLIAVDNPDYEIGFLKRFYDQSDKYDVDLIVTGSKAGNLSGQFPSRQTELNKYDLVVLYDPDPAKLEPKKDIIKSYLSEKGGALWVIMGKQFAERGPVKWLNDLLPFYQSNREEIHYLDYHGEPIEEQLFHPAVRLAESMSAIRDAWATLPPYNSLVACDVENPETVILVRSSLKTYKGQLPVLGYRHFGPGKLLAQTGLPFWPWGFINLGFGEDNLVYNRYVEGITSWLTVSDDLAPVRIVPDKEVFTRGENIRFEGFAYDPGFRPLTDVTGMVRLRGGEKSESFEMDLIKTSEGKYQAQFENLTPGKYTYEATIDKDGRNLKTEQGTILIESFSLEEFNQSGNPAGLNVVASLSGGSYFTYQDFDKAVNAIDTSMVHLTSDEEFSFWNKFWLLLIMVVALSLEWLLRKANQLV